MIAVHGMLRRGLACGGREHAVHLGEMRHVVQENVHLDDFLDRRVGFLQDGQDVLAALGGLVGDVAFDQGAGFVGGDLAGDEDVLADLDCLAL